MSVFENEETEGMRGQNKIGELKTNVLLAPQKITTLAIIKVWNFDNIFRENIGLFCTLLDF